MAEEALADIPAPITPVDAPTSTSNPENTDITPLDVPDASTPTTVSVPTKADQLSIPDVPTQQAAQTPQVPVAPKTVNDAFSPAIINAQAMQESSLNPLAVGPMTKYGTAKGKFQIIDSTWNQYALAGENKWNPEDSLKVRNRYMQKLQGDFPDNLNLQLAAYDWGEGNVKKAVAKAGTDDYAQVSRYFPAETLNYVSKIQGRAAAVSPELAKAVDDTKLPGIIDKPGFAKQLTPLFNTPQFQALSATDKLAAVNKIYNHNIYDPSVKDSLKELGDAIWTGASPEEMAQVKQEIGRPDPVALEQVPDVGKAIDAWGVKKQQELMKSGIAPELLNAPFKAHFDEVKADEVAAEGVRKDGYIGRFFTHALDNASNLAKGAASLVTEPAAYGARILADKLGAPDMSTAIEKLPSYIPGGSDRYYNYEVDDHGYVLMNDDGTPRTKFQTNFFRTFGNVLGAISGGAGLRVLGAGPSTITGVLSGANVLQQANGVFNEVYAKAQDKTKAYTASILAMPTAEAGALLELNLLGNTGAKALEGMSRFNRLGLMAKEAAFNTIPKGAAAGLLMDTGTQLAETSQTGEKFDYERLKGTVATMAAVGGLTGTATTFAERTERLARDSAIRKDVNTKLQNFQDTPLEKTTLQVDPSYIEPRVADHLGLEVDRTQEGVSHITKKNFIPDESTDSNEALVNATKGFTPTEVNSMHQEKGEIIQDLKNPEITGEERASKIARLQEIDKNLEGTDDPSYFSKTKANELEYFRKLQEEKAAGKPVIDLPVAWDPEISSWVDRFTGRDHPFLRGALGRETQLEARSTNLASTTLPFKSFYHENKTQTQQWANEFTTPAPYAANNPEPMSAKEVIDSAEKIRKLAQSKPGARGATVKEGGRLGKGVFGYYSPGAAVVRVRSMQDIPTFIHEITHQVDRDLGNLVFQMAQKDPKLSDALQKTALTYYPAPKQVAENPYTRLREGLTMFMENKLTNQPVHDYLNNWWENTFSKEHPDIYNQYKEAGKLADRYYNQTLEARVSAFKNPPVESKLKQWKTKLLDVNTWRAMADKDFKFTELDEMLGRSSNFDPRAWHNFIDALDLSNQEFAKNLVSGDHMMDRAGNILDGPTYMGIRKTLTAEQNDALDNGMIAAQAKEMIKRGQNPGLSMDDVLAMEKAYKGRTDIRKLENAQNAIYTWNMHAQDILTQYAPWLQASLQKLRAANKKLTGYEHGFYIPMKRVGGETSGGKGGSSTENATVDSPLMRRRGSMKPIQNISTSFEQLMTGMAVAADKNQLYAGLIRDLNNNKAVGGMIERIPPGMEKQYQNSFENILGQMLSTVRKDSGITEMRKNTIKGVKNPFKGLGDKAAADIDAHTQDFINKLSSDAHMSPEDILSSAVQFWHPETSLSPSTAAKGYMVLAIPKIGGKGHEFYEVHPNLLKAFSGVEHEGITAHPVFDILMRTPKRLLQVGATTINPVFQIRNWLVKDPQTALLTQGPGGSAAHLYKNIVLGLKDQVVAGFSSDTASPAALAQRLGLSTATRAGAAKELEYTAQGNGMIAKVFNATHKTIRAMEWVSGLGENATRVAAMNTRAQEMGLNLYDPKTKLTQLQAIELALAYKNSTINFSKRGDGAGITFLRESVPFFGARMAGLEQSIDAARQNPKRAGALAAGTFALGVYAYLNNRGKQWYDDLSESTKATSFVIENGRHMLAFPLDDYNAVFHSLGVAAAKQFVEGSPDEASTASILREALQKSSPIDLPLDKSGALSFFSQGAGPLGKEAVQQLVNQDFFRGTPIFDEKKATTQQFTNKTSEVMKEVGRITGMSPDRLEHFVNSFEAGPLKMEKFFEKQTGAKPVNEEQGTNFFLRAFMREASNAAIQDKTSRGFYEAKALATQNKYQETDDQAQARKRIDSIAKKLTDLNHRISQEEDPTARDLLYEERRALQKEGISLWKTPSSSKETTKE